jgi:hypothetical protein
MAKKLLRRLRPTEAWNRAALWVPFCTPFIIMTWTDSWMCREVLPLPWIHFRSLTVIVLMTLLSLQTRLKLCSSSWIHSMTTLVSKGLSWTLIKRKSWSSSTEAPAFPTFTNNGTLLELVTQFKYLGTTLTRDGSMHTAAKKMADNFRSATARVYRTGVSKGINIE